MWAANINLMPDLIFRRATAADVPAIVAMLADDKLGASREATDPESLPQYLSAFHEIDADANQFLLVVAVRVASERRGEKIGEAMIAWALEKCRSESCGIVQLTTDKSRTEAHRFYDRLGFKPSHIGYKMEL